MWVLNMVPKSLVQHIQVGFRRLRYIQGVNAQGITVFMVLSVKRYTLVCQPAHGVKVGHLYRRQYAMH